MFLRCVSTLVVVLAASTLAAQRPTGGQAGASPAWAVKELRAGIIGTDTSHVPQFAKIFASHPEWKIRIVAAFKGGSPDFPLSATRIDGFAKTIQDEHKVRMVDSIEALLKEVDVVFLTSVDGRPHLAQVTPVLEARKRVFIDKPLAASLSDVLKIVALSKKTGTPFFSASSVRFHPDLAAMKKPASAKGATVRATYLLNKVPFHPDLYYYGIHGVEALFEVMGRGCVSVTRKMEEEADVTTCTWKDGRTGVYHGLAKADPSLPLMTVSGPGGTTSTKGTGGSEELAEAIAEFFHTGKSPVDAAETIEVFEFMDAAQASKEKNGAAVTLDTVRQAVK
jgi:hypothetical protein